ncbi:MAG: hypothetical protein H0U71_06245 [Gammaproteobacteria bacterium]|nr:hypothetical protein [Gammaproteobacteria bacterium]
MPHTSEIRICMDIGNKKHRVAVGLSSGELLDKFDLHHTPSGINFFFTQSKNTKTSIDFLLLSQWKATMGTQDQLIN